MKKSIDTFSYQPFRDLKNNLKKKRGIVKPEATEKDVCLSDDELFHQSMGDVREIKKFRELPVYSKQAYYSCKPGKSDETLKDLEAIVSGSVPLHLPYTSEYVEWIDRGYRDSIIRGLHEGKYSTQDCLDLHGATVEEAKEEVELFIRSSVKKGYTCIKIIHGRGLRSPNGPVLKEAVVKWLLAGFRKYVAAFVTARQCDGGLGALYILLKQNSSS